MANPYDGQVLNAERTAMSMHDAQLFGTRTPERYPDAKCLPAVRRMSCGRCPARACLSAGTKPWEQGLAPICAIAQIDVKIRPTFQICVITHIYADRPAKC